MKSHINYTAKIDLHYSYYALSSSSNRFLRAILLGFSLANASTISIGSTSISRCVIKRQRLFNFDLPMVLRFQVLTSLKVEIFRSHSHEVMGRVKRIRSDSRMVGKVNSSVCSSVDDISMGRSPS